MLNKKNEFLINEIGDEGKNALHEAIEQTNVEVISFLLIKGTFPLILTHDEYSPLQLAIKVSSVQIMKILL